MKKRRLKGWIIGGVIGFVLPLVYFNIKHIILVNKIGFVCGNAGGIDFCSTFLDFIIQNFLPLPYTLGMIFWIGLIIGALLGFIINKLKK
ncbi:hypothetical protein KY347_04025 [Candidatus Woesearchaeota archaeon]|nr:hypothetical protein [Candidatus Woesearchaeota archaeon]